MPYTELYKSAKTSRRAKFQGKLSHESFSSRLDYFKGVGIVGECKHGYYLTERAYFLNRLKILYIGKPNTIFPDQSQVRGKEKKKLDQIRYFSTNQESSEQKIKIYMMLSYFSSGWNTINGLGPISGHALGFRRLSNEAQFKEFLNKYHLNEGALKIMHRPFSNSKYIEFFPDPAYGIMIQILKEGNSLSYRYALPGFSLSEIIMKDTDAIVFRYLPVKSSEVEEALDLLVENRFMERIGMFEGEMRYKLRAQPIPYLLHEQISKCWELQEEIFNIIIHACIIQKPKKEVKKWLGFFYGSEPNGPIEQWLQGLGRDRPKKKRSKQAYKPTDINKAMSSLQEEFGELIGPESYLQCHHWSGPYWFGFFVEKLLDFIYPHFMREGPLVS